MLLAPYVMTEDEKHPYFETVYRKLEKPIIDLFRRTQKVLQSSDLLNEYGYYGFIYRGTRYTGLADPTRRPLPILVDAVCPEFPTIHSDYMELLELKDRMFRALRQHELYFPPSTFMDGDTHPNYFSRIGFYLKVQEEYLEYMGRFLILKGMQ